jgi:hypothetical protein
MIGIAIAGKLLQMVRIFKKIVFFLMAPFLHPLSVRDSPFHHCFGLYTLGSFSRNIKSAHSLANFVSQASHVILSL